MTTTPDQKAMILDLWRVMREKRIARGEKLPVDVRHQIKFNWPHLSTEESCEVWEAYQRRMTMPRKIKAKLPKANAARKDYVSSPGSTAKHHVRCDLGGVRKYTEVFVSTRAAKVFLDAVLKNEAVKWESPEVLTAKGGVLRVQCEELEEIMEFDAEEKFDEASWKMPEEMQRQIDAFLRGKWTNKPKDVGVPLPKAPASGKVQRPAADGMVTLASICERRGWSARAVRVALRKSDLTKSDAGWVWSEKEAKTVEKQIEKLMS